MPEIIQGRVLTQSWAIGGPRIVLYVETKHVPTQEPEVSQCGLDLGDYSGITVDALYLTDDRETPPRKKLFGWIDDHNGCQVTLHQDADGICRQGKVCSQE